MAEVTKFVRRFQPKLRLSENVVDINNSRYGAVWSGFEQELRQAGCITGAKVVYASRFGAPQLGERSVFLGIRKQIVDACRLASYLGGELVVPEFCTVSGCDGTMYNSLVPGTNLAVKEVYAEVFHREDVGVFTSMNYGKSITRQRQNKARSPSRATRLGSEPVGIVGEAWDQLEDGCEVAQAGI